MTKEKARSLEKLGHDIDPKAQKWLISNDPLERQFGVVQAMHWKTAFKKLFS